MKIAFPAAKSLFGWGANEEHYTAVPALDHTPFSQSGWPLPSPQWWVLATDIMNRPDLGVDCTKLFPYWLSEAKAGRMPWLKYLIWQAKIYDVRYSWVQQKSSEHFDHIHISARTDHLQTSLGSWSLLPGAPPAPKEEDMPMYVWCNGALWASNGAWRYHVPANVAGVKRVFEAQGWAWKSDTDQRFQVTPDELSGFGRDVAEVGAGPELLQHTHENSPTGPAQV